jgi:dihydrofolate reductase
MRKIVAAEFISLDGVVESPDKWSGPYFSDELGQAIGAQMAASDTMLLGRVGYQEFAAHWPDQTGEIASFMNDTPKLVVSTTLTAVDEWQNSSLVPGEVVQELATLKQRPGGQIIITGSSTLVRSLLRVNLLDELRLLVCPVVVGTGKRLFPDGCDPADLALVETQTLGAGVIYATYTPAGT